MPFLPDDTRLYTHAQGVALDYQAFTLATSAQGRMRTEVGGAFVQMYDANLQPIDFVTTNPDTGGFPLTYAPLPRVVWDFGSLQLPSVSVESIEAGERALTAAQQAVTRVENLAQANGSYATTAQVEEARSDVLATRASETLHGLLRLAGDLTGNADAPTVVGYAQVKASLAAAVQDIINLRDSVEALRRQIAAGNAGGGSTTDTTPPSVALTAPAANAAVSGTVLITGTATDTSGVAVVEVTAGGIALSGVSYNPSNGAFSVAWATGQVANGSTQISVRARDNAGNTSVALTRVVTVNNATADTVDPTVSIASPAANASVSGVVTITGAASDNVGVASVAVTAGGTALAVTRSGSSWSATWDVTSLANGVSTISATATDTSGRTATATRQVLVSNAAAAQPGTTNGYPVALGTLSAPPAWADTSLRDTPRSQTIRTPTRTLALPNMPTDIGGDITAAWRAYFGDRVGNRGTWAEGDRVILDGDVISTDNLDLPPHCRNIDIVLGTTNRAFRLRTTQMTTTNGVQRSDRHAIRIIGSTGITLRAASRDFPALLETTGVTGRTGLNQQGNTMILVDPGSVDVQVQDVICRGARAAGVFLYNATNVWLNRVVVEDSLADAFHITNGSSYVKVSDCVSRRPGDDGIAAVHYDGSSPASVSHHVEIYRHRVITNGHGRGFAIICCRDIFADQVIVEGSAAAGVIVDREAGGTANTPQGISNVLLQRFLVQGCNWSEQDHGSVFVRNHTTTAEVRARLESFTIRDANNRRQRVRAIGNGGGANDGVLDVVMKDFSFVGGQGGDTFGGNNLSRIVRENWTDQSVAGEDTTPPTVVWNTPGALATITGTLTGSTTDTSAMTNSQALQFYMGDAKAAGIANLEVRLGDTVLASGLASVARDNAGRGSLVLDTTRFANGTGRLRLRVTDQVGNYTIRSRPVTINNASPGTLSGLPTDGVADGRYVVGTATGGPGGDTSTLPPGVVTDLVVSRPASGQNRLTWSPPSGTPAAAGYNVYGGVQGQTPALLNPGGLVTTASFVHTGTTNGSGYYYEVESVSASGVVSRTRAAGNTTGPFVNNDTTPPTTPANFAASRSADSSASGTASWTASTDNVSVAGYWLYWTPSGGAAARLNNALVTATTYTITGLTASAGVVSIEATDAAGNTSPRANVSLGAFSTTDTTRPTAPTNLTVTRPASGQNRLAWTAGTDNVAVAGYNVYGGLQGSTPALLNTGGLVVGTTYTHTGTTNGSGYYYEVETVDTSGLTSAARATISTSGAYVEPTAPTATTAPPSTTATRMLYVDPATATVAGDNRITTVPVAGSSASFGWATAAERPFLVDGPNGKKVARFDNRRLLLEGSGVTGRARVTLTLVMAVLQQPTERDCGLVSGVSATANDYDGAAGQWNISQPNAVSETDFRTMQVYGAVGDSDTKTQTFAAPVAFRTLAVVQIFMAADGTAPVVRVNGTAASTTALGRTTSSLVQMDRILLGGRWFGGNTGRRDVKPTQYDLAAMIVHDGHLSTADQNAVRTWAADAWGTPRPQ